MFTPRWYQEAIPQLDTIVIASVSAISDDAVSLPAFGSVEAVLLPSEERTYVCNYGQLIPVRVVRTGPIHVSMKGIDKEKGDAALHQYYRDAKVDRIVRVAAYHIMERMEELYRDVIWPLRDGLEEAYEDVYSVFEEICAQGSAATMVLPVTIPDALVRAARANVAVASYTASKEVKIRFGTSYEGVQALTQELNRLGRMEGIRVLITAPPTFKLIATDQTQTRAAARLAAAIATIPPAF